MHAVSIREHALRLRVQGYSYRFISQQTGLSKSTLSGILNRVPYTPNAQTVAYLGQARTAALRKKTQNLRFELERIRKEATAEIGMFSKRDLFIFGLGLYMGEGAKTHSCVSIANADPEVARVAVEWFKSLGVETHQFSPRIHLYPDSDVEHSLAHWSKALGVPISQFQKSYIDRRVGKKYKKRGKLPFETLYLTIRSKGKKEHGVFLFRKIQEWNRAVLDRVNKKAGLV